MGRDVADYILALISSHSAHARQTNSLVGADWGRRHNATVRRLGVFRWPPPKQDELRVFRAELENYERSG